MARSNSALHAVRLGEASGPRSPIGGSDPASQRLQNGWCSGLGADSVSTCTCTRVFLEVTSGWGTGGSVWLPPSQPTRGGRTRARLASPARRAEEPLPTSQSGISRLSYGPQYLQREDFTVVVQPFFQNTLVPLNSVSAGISGRCVWRGSS